MDILAEVTDEELMKANQASLINFFRMNSNNSDDIEYVKQSGVEGLHSGMPVAILNRIIKTDINRSSVDQVLEKIKKIYHEKGIAVHWEVWPSTTPSNFKQLLINYGFEYEDSYPAMGIDLKCLAQQNTSSLKIKRVENVEQANILANVFADCYGLPASAKQGFLNTVLSAGFEQKSKLVNYIGYEDNKPVCMSSVYFDSGVAGIYNVGTLKQYSRRGYGTMITRHPLIEANKMGYNYAILQSSSQGEKVYKRMGFRELCTVERYKLEPSK